MNATEAPFIATGAIDQYRRASDRFAHLCHREAELAAELPVLVQGLVNTLVGTYKPGAENAEKPKLHSVSSAEEAAKVDQRVLDHKAEQRNVVLQKDLEFGMLTAYRLEAELCIAQINASRVLAPEGAPV